MSQPERCEACGSALVPGARFCASCDQPAAMPWPPAPIPEAPASQEAAAPQPKTGADKRGKRPATDAAEPPLQWECRVPVLTNRFMMWDFAKVMVIAVIVIEAVGALMTFIIDGEAFFLPPLVFGIPLAVLAVLYVLVDGAHPGKPV